ncbi:hypothetical protein CesoFtcFv8_023484 [Champsocephalus esox]|uniref:Uncharacterized protein n=1 Tax=Champsocephalus esox TaxID=159716 RepID=A0AAN8B8C9_9TELE|nr:hypothetical protein CesoFtcFv8_023484 [Champsocephalus esox]
MARSMITTLIRSIGSLYFNYNIDLHPVTQLRSGERPPPPSSLPLLKENNNFTSSLQHKTSRFDTKTNYVPVLTGSVQISVLPVLSELQQLVVAAWLSRRSPALQSAAAGEKGVGRSDTRLRVYVRRANAGAGSWAEHREINLQHAVHKG